MIDDNPGTFTPLEVARNRLAKTLFAFWTLLFVLALTANDSATEFASKESLLQEHVDELQKVRNRLVQLLEVDASYLQMRLHSAIDRKCLTREEARRPGSKQGGALLVTKSGVEDHSGSAQATNWCQKQFVTLQVESENLLAPIAGTMRQMLLDEHMPPAVVVQ